ncbi:hypothetical protein DVK05_06200 [Halorubrum sp. Atlit-8R]|nr:hypothetical protein DVK08_13220 [Halorubrum sp. Atlit-9R]RLM81644.1 hypothetical protein DVK05_06200 [Halorubrum sp. Atlit-8R]
MKRRQLLGAVGVSVTASLAGCSTEWIDAVDDQGGASGDDSASETRSRLSTGLARIDIDEYDAEVLVVRTFSLNDLSGVKESMAYLRRLDAAIPMSLDIDLGSLADAVVVSEGTLVELTAPGDGSFESAVSGLEGSSEQIGAFDLYSVDDGVVAIDGRRLLLARADDSLSLSPRELVRRVIEGESTEGSTATTTERAAVESVVDAVEADALRSVAVPLNGDAFGPETRFVPGARAAAWGVAVGDSIGGPSVETKLAVGFPEGEASTRPVVDALPEEWGEHYTGGDDGVAGPRVVGAIDESEFVHVDADTASVEGNTVTVTASGDGEPHDGRNPYLRPRGVDDLLIVEVTARQYEFRFSYPQYGVTGREELVVPVDRPVAFGLKSEDVHHRLHVPDSDPELVYDIYPGIERFTDVVTLSGSGEYAGVCREYCGAGHTNMVTSVRVTGSSAFDDWIGAA